MANYLGFLLFEKEITFFINILIPIVELIMDFFTLFPWEKTTQSNFLVKISVHTYRTHTNSAPGYYFLARLFGGSSNGIFSNTRPLRPTFY